MSAHHGYVTTLLQQLEELADVPRYTLEPNPHACMLCDSTSSNRCDAPRFSRYCGDCRRHGLICLNCTVITLSSRKCRRCRMLPPTVTLAEERLIYDMKLSELLDAINRLIF